MQHMGKTTRNNSVKCVRFITECAGIISVFIAPLSIVSVAVWGDMIALTNATPIDPYMTEHGRKENTKERE